MTDMNQTTPQATGSASDQGKAVLSVESLEKSFGAEMVLKDISFEVNPGEVVSIIGPSGSGKSTLLRCCTLLETFESGALRYGDLTVAENNASGKTAYSGKDVAKEARKRFGLVFQNFNLFPHYSVLRNVMEAPVIVEGKDKAETEKLARALLKQMGLEGREDAYPCELSGGQQQRVAIGRALVTRPALIMADEPTGNLDSKNSQEVIALLQSMSSKYQQTILMITHNENHAGAADRVFRMSDGVLKDLGVSSR